MFKDFDFEQLKTLIRSLKSEVRTLREQYDIVEDAIYDIAFAKALERAGKIATSILITNALDAIQSTDEYKIPEYTLGLFKAIRDPKTIEVVRKGKKSILVDVRINLDKTAGKLEVYAHSVKRYRTILEKRKKRGKERNSPPTPIALASKMWAEKFYSAARNGTPVFRKRKVRGTDQEYRVDLNAQYSAKYWETIRGRMAFWGGAAAPWWSLLENGNTGIKMSSDIGGQPFPINAPTHFVAKSKEQIKLAFVEILRDEIINYKGKADKKLQRSVELIESRLGEERFKKANFSKVIALAKKLATSTDLNPSGRYRLGSNVEVRTRSIIAQLDMEFESGD